MPTDFIRRADSASTHYQQYVQLISDGRDAVDAAVAAQLAWASALIDFQHAWLDAYKRLLATELAGAQKLIDTGARLALSTEKAA